MGEGQKAVSSRAYMKCACGETYFAREADLKRGWGLSCSKRCAAIRRDYGRPKAVRIKSKARTTD